MADRDTTQVGYRLRGFGPTDLSTFPDRVKLMYWQWVVELGLERKDKELARGWDKNGNTHRLKPKTIKYRKSEVGPVHPNAPRLIPALNLSRVRSLLTGRAHTTSAEFWWQFDAVTGESFAVILHYAADAGHDVFGLSPTGTAWVTREAAKKWLAWKAGVGGARATAEALGVRAHAQPAIRKPVRVPIPKVEVRQPIPKVNLSQYDLFPGVARAIKDALAFTGFRRLNARGEQWKPGTGLGPK